MKTKKEEETTPLEPKFVLPEEMSIAIDGPPRDLVIIGQPKIGKGTILGAFTNKYNALVFDLEKGGYDYISARKLSTYTTPQTSKWESFQNYIKYRKALLDEKGKYDYLIIDGLSDLDELSEIGGTLAYMKTTQGKKFNREGNLETGKKYVYTDPEWRSVITLPEGFGYQHSRKWFLEQIEYFREISNYRIYAAHVADKFISDSGKEAVVSSEISLTGKLKTIFASRVTALCKLIIDGDDRYLNFEVQNDSIIAGSRSPKLKDKILISSMDKNGQIETFWKTIYN